MTLREKIIVGMAGLALLYGAYELGLKNLLTRPGAPGGRPEKAAVTPSSSRAVSPVEDHATDKAPDQATAGDLTRRDRYIIDHRNSRWETDPFVSGETMAAAGAAEGGRASEAGNTFVYSGYLAVGDVRLAVINGREYREGERLVDGRHVLRRIQPTRVVLSGGGGEIIVKLKETEARVE